MIFTAFSLFAGAGGIDVGIREAGFRTLCAIESDPHCAATLRRNDTRKVVWQADVGVIDPVRAMAALGLTAGTLGLLTCGPPTRPVLRSGGEDPRIPATFEVLRFATVLRPYAILIAQAPAFLPIRIATGRRLLEVLRERLDGLGYDMHADVVDACDLGVAQRRRCAVVVGVPRNHPFELPSPELRTPSPTVAAAFRGLPAPSRRGEPAGFPNHVDITPARARERIAHVPEGLWLAKAWDAPAAVRGRLTARDTTKFRRLNRTAVAPTLHAGEALFHPTRGSLHHDAGSRSATGLPGQARVRRPAPSPNRASQESGSISAGGEFRAARIGAFNREKPPAQLAHDDPSIRIGTAFLTRLF